MHTVVRFSAYPCRLGEILGGIFRFTANSRLEKAKEMTIQPYQKPHKPLPDVAFRGVCPAVTAPIPRFFKNEVVAGLLSAR